MGATPQTSHLKQRSLAQDWCHKIASYPPAFSFSLHKIDAPYFAKTEHRTIEHDSQGGNHGVRNRHWTAGKSQGCTMWVWLHTANANNKSFCFIG
jgi:hypothetical protein